MRVIAGVLGGQRIDTPHGTAVRPTTDRVREAIFNSLGSLGVVDGAVVLDLFAGSGALGIESLSRGAESCTFIEQDRAVAQVISDNVDRLGLGDRSEVRIGDAVRLASGLEADLVFADPPYGYDKWSELLSGLEASYVVVEADQAVDPEQVFAGEPPMALLWRQIRVKRYGRTWVTFLERIDTAADH